MADTRYSRIGKGTPEETPSHSIIRPESSGDVAQRVVSAISHFAATPGMFLGTVVLVAGWAVAGIPLKASDDWLIVMSNTSSVQVYLWDIFRIFSQPRETEQIKNMLGSCIASHTDKLSMLETALQRPPSQHMQKPSPSPPAALEVRLSIPKNGVISDDDVPTSKGCVADFDQRYNSAASSTATFLGSPWAQMAFDAGFLIWLGFGPSEHWSDTWQLWANAMLAVQQTICATLLHNVSMFDSTTMQGTGKSIEVLDSDIQERIAMAFKSAEAEAGTETASVPLPSTTPINEAGIPTAMGKAGPGTSWWRRTYDAFEMGCVPVVDWSVRLTASPGFLAFSGVLACVWVGLGKKMGYYNPNWWLLIGTYTGMASYVIEYMIRNVQFRDNTELLQLADEALARQGDVLRKLGRSPVPEVVDHLPNGVFHRTNRAVAYAAATGVSVVGAQLFIVFLIIMATAMGWNLTAQLLCNTPTMFLDSIALLILLAGNADATPRLNARLAAQLQGQKEIEEALTERGIA